VNEFILVLDNGDRIEMQKHEDHVILRSTNEKHILAEAAEPHGIKVHLQ
jgi:hypothetical protein